MENKFNLDELFFCYSYRLQMFLSIFNIHYINDGTNSKNGKKYFVYKKSNELKYMLDIWNDLKGKIPLN